MSRRLRRTKIVTTLGPATDRDNNLEKIIAAGANVVRMNFSHGTPEDHKLRADKVREIAAKLGRHVAILGDLQGPKIRVSTFKEGKVFLNIGDKFLLDASTGKGEGDKEKVGIDYKGLPADVVRRYPAARRRTRTAEGARSSGNESVHRSHRRRPALQQ